MKRQVVVTMAESGAVESVVFVGGHLTKRELTRVLTAIKQGRNHRIREYRREQIKSELEQGKDGQSEDNTETGSATLRGGEKATGSDRGAESNSEGKHGRTGSIKTGDSKQGKAGEGSTVAK